MQVQESWLVLLCTAKPRMLPQLHRLTSVREMKSFGEGPPREGSRNCASAMVGILLKSYPTMTGSYPARMANLSLIDSISHVLLAIDQEKDTVESYLATLGTPNQPVCCTQASMRACAKPASKAAARRVWLRQNKGNKLKRSTANAPASAGATGTATEEQAADSAKPS